MIWHEYLLLYIIAGLTPFALIGIVEVYSSTDFAKRRWFSGICKE